MLENTDQNNSEYGHFSHNVYLAQVAEKAIQRLREVFLVFNIKLPKLKNPRQIMALSGWLLSF